jgi:hypothetical protein
VSYPARRNPDPVGGDPCVGNRKVTGRAGKSLGPYPVLGYVHPLRRSNRLTAERENLV